jgi:hypothetical protein
LTEFINQSFILLLFFDVSQQNRQDVSEILFGNGHLTQLTDDVRKQIVDWIVATLTQFVEQKP